MSVTYDIDAEASHVLIVGSGTVSMSTMINTVLQVADDPRFFPHFTITLDVREAKYTAELADGDALATVLRQKQTNFQNRFAVVVSESLHVLARLYCTLATVGGFDRIRCFTDMEKAEAWCDTGH